MKGSLMAMALIKGIGSSMSYSQKYFLRSNYSMHKKTYFLFLVLMTGFYSLNAQPCYGNLHTTAIDTNNYTVGPNQILCIDSGSVYSGKLSLAGGDVCIKGTANPSSVEFVPTTIGGSAGKITINSNGSLSTRSNFSIGKISLIVNRNGALNILGDLILVVSGSSITNQGVINIQKNLQINVGCTITNNGNISYLVLQNNNGNISGSGNLISSTQINQQ